MGADNYERELEDADNQIARDKARIAKLEGALRTMAEQETSDDYWTHPETRIYYDDLVQQAREALKDE